MSYNSLEMAAPVSIIILTLNAAQHIPENLQALMPGVEAGVIRELIISDGGSTDAIEEIAGDIGAVYLSGSAGRGTQLRRGALISKGEWLLFLHADTVLEADWQDAVLSHISTYPDKAGVFWLKFRAEGIAPRLVAAWANLRSRVFDLPYGDQGLLISRKLYDQSGGFPDQLLMEDVEIARALSGQIILMDGVVTTDSEKYQRNGWFRQGMGNLCRLIFYLLGCKSNKIMQSYN